MLTVVGTGKSDGELAEIQSCGFMVVVDQGWRVAHVSANIGDHFADCGPFMAGQSLAEFVGAAAVHSMRNQLALMRDPQGTARLFSLYFASVPKPFDVALHFHEGKVVLEALPAAHGEARDSVGMVRQLAASLDACDTVTDVMQRGAHLMRALVGFDSVTIFRLDAEGAAQVEAFLDRHPGWHAEQPDLPLGRPRGKGWRLTPFHDGTDGFFIARLSRAC